MVSDIVCKSYPMTFKIVTSTERVIGHTGQCHRVTMATHVHKQGLYKSLYVTLPTPRYDNPRLDVTHSWSVLARYFVYVDHLTQRTRYINNPMLG